MATEGKFGALATLVAKDLSEIADLPEYKTPPPGVYRYLIESCKQKDINGKTAIVTEYVIVECIELNDPDEYPENERVKAGDKFSEAFWFNDPERVDTTVSVLKAKYGNLAEKIGTTNLAVIMDKMCGLVVQSKITNRVDKDVKNKIYPQTRDIQIAT